MYQWAQVFRSLHNGAKFRIAETNRVHLKKTFVMKGNGIGFGRMAGGRDIIQKEKTRNNN